MKGLRILQLNVEQSKHTERILPFLKTNTPEVICFQEVMESNVPLFCEVMGARFHHFAQTSLRDGTREGLLLASRYPLSSIAVYHYAGAEDLLEHIKGFPWPEVGEFKRTALFGTITTDDADIRVGVTHFTWTPDGSASNAQREAFAKLCTALKQEKDFILCGDFNAPRGGEIWGMFAARYRDNIPAEYTWSLDQELHRAPLIEREKMVDGIFSTPEYTIANVERVCGLSDHCGFTAIVSHATPTAVSLSQEITGETTPA